MAVADALARGLVRILVAVGFGVRVGLGVAVRVAVGIGVFVTVGVVGGGVPSARDSSV